jgi:hypothetical protein
VAVDGGYPLTMRTYAAVNVCLTATPDLRADATFLGYAAGNGQDPGTKIGQLPIGYVPLTSADHDQTAKVATALRSEATSPKCASHLAPSSPTPPPGTSSSGSGSGSGTSGSGSSPGGSAPGVNPPPGSAMGTNPAAQVVAPITPGSVGITPTAFLTAANRYALLAAFLFFLPCAVFGPTLLVSARRKT